MSDRSLDWEIHLRHTIEGAGMYGNHPRYTDSLDAAIALVPKGWSWRVGTDEGRQHPQVSLGRSHPTNAAVHQEGHTPPIALCIAALKAEAQP